jgi:hypothetical protein
LPSLVAEPLWLDEHGLLALLTPAAIAGHPSAAHAMTEFLHGDAGLASRKSTVGRAVLGRLREEAILGSADALKLLIDHTEATGNTAELAGVLRRLPVPVVQQYSDLHGRLSSVRRALTASSKRGNVRDGYALWRLLLERGVDHAPDPSTLAETLSDCLGSNLATAVLEMTLTCVHLTAANWSASPLTALTDRLSEIVASGHAERMRLQRPLSESRSLGSRQMS